MTGWVRVTISALLSGLIAGGGAILAVAQALPPKSGLDEIGAITWLIFAAVTIVAFAKDAQSQLTEPTRPPLRSYEEKLDGFIDYPP